MEGANYAKLLDAGFKIYRLNLERKTITSCAGFGRWNKFMQLTSKAEAKREYEKLMEHPRNLGD